MSRIKNWLVIMNLCFVPITVRAGDTSGLIAEWNFDEGQGDVAHDSSGNKHDAKIYGASWVKPGDSFALSLNGQNDYVEYSESRPLHSGGPVTVEAWIMP